MTDIGVPSPGQQRLKPARRMKDGWGVPALAGAAAFWVANLVVSATPAAAGYRSALSIPYVPMLAGAAAGGLVLGGVLAFVLAHHPVKIPGSGPLSKALVLGAAALVVLTVGLEVPSKLGSDVHDPAHWLLVATVFNVIRILALAVTVGLVTGGGDRRRGRHRIRTRRETPR